MLKVKPSDGYPPEEVRRVVWIAATNPMRHFVTVEVNDGHGNSSWAKVALDVSCCK